MDSIDVTLDCYAILKMRDFRLDIGVLATGAVASTLERCL
jgi:hypothetical protein